MGRIILAMGVLLSSALLGSQPTLQVFEASLEADDEQFTDGSFFDSYQIAVDSDSYFNITLESEDFDAYVVLTSPSGWDYEVDDSELLNPGDSFLSHFAQEAGVWTVRATSYEAGSLGDYTLSVHSWPVENSVTLEDRYPNDNEYYFEHLRNSGEQVEFPVTQGTYNVIIVKNANVMPIYTVDADTFTWVEVGDQLLDPIERRSGELRFFWKADEDAIMKVNIVPDDQVGSLAWTLDVVSIPQTGIALYKGTLSESERNSSGLIEHRYSLDLNSRDRRTIRIEGDFTRSRPEVMVEYESRPVTRGSRRSQFVDGAFDTLLRASSTGTYEIVVTGTEEGDYVLSVIDESSEGEAVLPQ